MNVYGDCLRGDHWEGKWKKERILRGEEDRSMLQGWYGR
jgi:hypothetical protein